MIDNSYFNDIQLFDNIIKKWKETALIALGNTMLVSNHIDEIMGQKIPRDKWLKVSLNLFERLLAEMTLTGFVVQPHLLIPLKSSKGWFTMKPPNSIEDIYRQLNLREPPSLYLIRWENNKQLPELYEQLKIPIKINLLAGVNGNIYSYYSVFRSGISIERNWEFGRGIHVEGFLAPV